MLYNKDLPFNNLPPIPPAAVELETRAVLKQTTASGRALAELKGAGNLIPNQSILIRLIGLQEAKMSSQIENIVTTNDELYRAFSEQELGLTLDPVAKEVLHYNDALWHGYDLLKNGRPITTTTFVDIVRKIRENEAGIRRTPGTVIMNNRGEVVYRPPERESIIRDKLQNLETFINEPSEIDPLVKMAVMHYQFEAIHPFSDGNGRTGRILNILYLISENLLEIPVLYMSRYINDHRMDYYQGLRGVTENNEWEAWILFMLKAVEATALETHRLILDIRDLMENISEKVRHALPKIYSKDLIEVLFTHPYCKIRFLETAGITATRQTASRYLQELNRIGVVERHDFGRDAYFLNREFYNLLTK